MFEKQISNLGQFQGIQLETDISVITLNDEINHTYCSKIKWEQDNRAAIGIAKLIMPYSTEIASYWMKYSGAVVIHANLNSRPRTMTQAMMESLPTTMSLNMKKFLESQIDDEDNKKISEIISNTDIDNQTKAKTLNEAKTQALKKAKQKLSEKKKENSKNESDKTKKKNIEKDEKTKQLHFKNDEYNYAYIGKVSRFKQVGTTFIVYLEDLGWKFMQKVPKEFRDAYISGQTLDNAFQAICEFMGVEFAYSIEDLAEYNFGADGYSVEKDGQVIEDVSTVLSEWGGKDEEDEESEEELSEDEKKAKALEDESFESTGLIEYKKKKLSTKKKSNKSNKNNQNKNKSLNSQITNSTDEANKNNNNKDNNNNNQNEDNKQATSAEKIEKYQEEFDDKIKHLFMGNTFYDSNVSDPILNYDWITIVPVAPQNTSTAAGAANATGASNNNSNTDSNKNGWHDGQLYENGKIVLYSSYINSLSPDQASAKYKTGQNTYTSDTLSRLAKRAAGAKV